MKVLGTLILVLVGFGFAQAKDSSKVTSFAEVPVRVSELSEYGKNNASVFQMVAPEVVFVHNLRTMADISNFDVFQVQQGTGSGFVWDNKGHIVTNFHVINNADEIAVTFQGGKKIAAKIIGAEPRKDIAVLKIELPKKFEKPLHQRLADVSSLIVGQKAIAIGNPFGLDHTMSVGIVSALGRSVRSIGGVTIRDMIQTDAAINPGNSGGPLLDNRGYLLGMNTAIFSPTGASAGVGFAVPANTINKVVTQIINYGKVIQPGLGIVRMDDSVARYLGIEGVIVGDTLRNGPARKAGLRGTKRNRLGEIILGDVIIAINGTKVTNYDDLYNVLEKYKIGDSVRIKYSRNGKTKELTLKLAQLE